MQKTSSEEKKQIQKLVDRYTRNRAVFEHIAGVLFDAIQASTDLRPLVHSVKYRTKDPEHLRDKLYRKLRRSKEDKKVFDITEENLFQKINDLAGVRILHLHTSQIEELDAKLQACLANEKFVRREGPIAKTWDDEYRRFFESLKIETEVSRNQYTSVHYVFDAENDLGITAEVQVRTLAEELWGEVDHLLNYPHKHRALVCSEQIAVLARVTSSATRLVDSIFRADKEFRAKT